MIFWQNSTNKSFFTFTVRFRQVSFYLSEAFLAMQIKWSMEEKISKYFYPSVERQLIWNGKIRSISMPFNNKLKKNYCPYFPSVCNCKSYIHILGFGIKVIQLLVWISPGKRLKTSSKSRPSHTQCGLYRMEREKFSQ